MVVKTEKKERLSLDVVGQLEDAVLQDPLDYKSWTKLIDQVIVKDKEDQVRSVFDRYLAIFKFDARQWSSYVNFELNRADFQRVVDLFAKCLPITSDVDLCRTYVLYVRRVNDVITGGEKARSTVVLAFDFAVNKCGIDIDSSDLWNDYLDFFKTWTPGTSWEQQQKNDLIRKLYRRCLVIPNARIESMWSDYTKWENEVSTPNNASKNIADLSTEYMEARSWNTEWKNVTSNLIRRRLVPVSAVDDPNDIVKGQLEAWLNWLEFEKKNGLNLNEQDLQHRIDYVFKRAVTILPFVPEVWFRYNKFLLQENEDANKSHCIELLTDGIRLNPKSFLLCFQLAELYERDGTFPKAQEVYDSSIKVFVQKHSAVKSKIDQINENSAKRAGLEMSTKKENEENGGNSDSDDDTPEQPVVQYSESEALQIFSLESQLHELNKSVTFLYIKLMALCKRSQGIKEVRAVFKQRKNFKSLAYEFYVENALIEYYSDNKKIADKVFDLAMKSFSSNGGFLYAYLDYLILTNSIESIKVFFEMALTNLLKEITSDREGLQIAINILEQKKRSENLKKNEYFMKKIIRRYTVFASNYLDLDTVLSLEKRYLQYFPDEDGMALFIDRYKAPGFDGVAKYDLGSKMDVGLQDVEDEDVEIESTKKRRKVAMGSDNYSPETVGSKSNQNDATSQAAVPVTQQHGFVGNTIYNLLQILPNAGYFGPPSEHIFDNTKLVELFGNLPSLPGEF